MNNMRSLMSCIAYSSTPNEDTKIRTMSTSDIGSSSSSDITDVSSLSNITLPENEQFIKSDEKFQTIRGVKKSGMQSSSSGYSGTIHRVKYTTDHNKNSERVKTQHNCNKGKEDEKYNDLRLIAAALGAFEIAKNKKKIPRSLNHSFPPDQIREITRENLSLLERLHREKTRPVDKKQPHYKHVPRESSSAINRRHLQRQIQRENMGSI